MPWRRRERGGGTRARRAFESTVERVEEAKRSLVAVVPAGRAPGAPLADALLAFEEGLRDARDGMTSWRAPATAEAWRRCDAAILEALDRAERLRLAAPQLDYEGLVMTLGRLLEPLEAFEDAERIV